MKGLLEKNKNLLKGVGASLVSALGMAILPHAEVVIAIILILGVMFLKLDERKRSVLIKTFLIVAIVVIAIVFHIFYCNKKEDVNNTLPETTQEQKDQKATDNTTPVANTAPVSTEITKSVNAVNTNTRRQNITDNERAKSQDLNPIYGGGEGDNANKNGGTTEIDNSTSTMEGQDGEESVEYQEEAAKAEQEEDIKVEQNNDSSFTFDDNTSEEEKADAGNINGSTDSGDENTSWKDTANGDNVTEYEPVKVEDGIEEPVKDNNVVAEEEKQPVKDNNVVAEEEKQPVEDNNVVTEEEKQPVEDNNVVAEEEEQPVKVEKLSVEALDGNVTTVGSDVQYKVTGEGVSFEGLEGFEYNYNDGILTISTGSEATILTFNVLNTAGDSIMIDLTINGIVK